MRWLWNRLGDDGLTRRERQRRAREYMATAGWPSERTPQEWAEYEARVKARIEARRQGT